MSLGFTVVLKVTNMLPIDIDGISDEEASKRCKDFSEQFKLNLRLYKTKNGHRAIITNRKFDIKSDFDLISSYFKTLKADMRYLDVALNREIDYFHMRIVPKDQSFKTFNEEQIIKHFLDYHSTKNLSVCRYIGSFGNGIILEDFKKNIEKHDYATKAFNQNSILV